MMGPVVFGSWTWGSWFPLERRTGPLSCKSGISPATAGNAPPREAKPDIQEKTSYHKHELDLIIVSICCEAAVYPYFLAGGLASILLPG